MAYASALMGIQSDTQNRAQMQKTPTGVGGRSGHNSVMSRVYYSVGWGSGKTLRKAPLIPWDRVHAAGALQCILKVFIQEASNMSR